MKSIKLTIAALALFSLVSSVNAQTAEDYAAVAEFLPAEKLVSIQENGAKYAEYAYLNRHGYYVGLTGPKDISDFPDLTEIEALYPGLPELSETLIESGELNLMGYNFTLQRDLFTYYRIGIGDKILVIPPTKITLDKLTSETE